MTAPATRRRLLRAVLAAAATCMGLAVAEGVARLTYGPGFLSVVDPYEHHPFRPGVEYVDTAGNRVFTNSLGWKDLPSRREVARDPAPERRVVLLGDSFTEGLGLPAEETLAAWAEQELDNEAGGGSGGWQVLNGGRVSYSPLLSYKRLERFLDMGYRTDVVVLLPDLSDVQDELHYAAEYELAPDGEPLRLRGTDYHPLVRGLYNRSALARWLRRAQLRLQGRAPAAEVAHAGRQVVLGPAERALLAAPGPLTLDAYAGLPPDAKAVLRHAWIDHAPSLEGWAADGLARLTSDVARLHRLAERHGIRLVVVVYPGPLALYTGDDPARYAELRRRFPRWLAERESVHGTRPSAGAPAYRRALAELCRERSIPFVDLFPAFLETPDWPLLFLPGDVHFSPAGSRLVGRRIAEAVRGLDGIPAGGGG